MAQSRARRILTAPFRGLKAATSRMVHPNGAMQWLIGGTSQIDYSRSVGDGTTSSVVVAPLRWLQRNVTQAPFRIRTIDTDGQTLTPVTAGSPAQRMLDLVAMPNPHYHGGALRKAKILSWILDGNTYERKIRNSMGAVVAIWWIPHTLIEPKRTEGSGDFISYYEYTPGGGHHPERIPVEDIVHMRDGIDPSNTMLGMSAFKALLREVYTDNEASAYTATMLANMGVPGLIVSPAVDSNGLGGPQDEDLEDVKTKINQITTGNNRGKTVVMNGPTTVTQLGFNPQQMNVRDLRKVPEERVSGCIGVAAVVCGLGAGLDRSTFANMAEAREASTEEALIPYWGEEALAYAHQLLPDFEGDNAGKLRVDVDLSEVRVLGEDQDKIIERAARLVTAGIAEVAEGRQAAGLPVDESHHIFLRPAMSIEVPAGESVNDSPPPPEAPKMKGLSGRQRAQLEAAMAHIREHHETSFAKALMPVFADLGDHVASVWAGEYAKALKTAPDPELVAVTAATLRKSDLKAWVGKHLEPVYRRHYAAVYAQTSASISSTIGLSIEDAAPELELAALKRSGEAIKLVKIEESTQFAIFKALEQGRELGLNPVDLERKIRDYVEAGGPTANVSARAMRIARTETRTAQNLGALDTYKTTGVYDSILVLDNRTGHDDEDCMQRDETIASFDLAESYEDDEHPNGTLDITTPANVRDDS